MSTRAHVLVVEDEPKLAALLRDYLVVADYRVSVLETGAGAIAWIREHTPDTILLDLMLPGEDGLAICRGLRAFSNVPILMVSARVDESDRLLGLELGADHYIRQPSTPLVPHARRRSSLPPVPSLLRPTWSRLRASPSPAHLSKGFGSRPSHMAIASGPS